MADKLGQTVTVVNQSGKIIKESKHFINTFKEARSAYRERKAEIKAVRDAQHEEKRALRAIKVMTINDDDAVSRAPSKASRAPSRVPSRALSRVPSRAPSPSSQHPERSHTHSHPRRPPLERGVTDNFYENDGRGMAAPQRKQMTRRHTEAMIVTSKPKPSRSRSDDGIDMDLAYGYLPPQKPDTRIADEAELHAQASKLTRLLDEANCLQYSVTTMIESLQKNPDALASVALTLAEISGLVGKMAPGVLGPLKFSFPAVAALLASPQFLIAAGVSVGVTIIALGGFKIIRRIKEEKEEERVRELEAPLELNELIAPELSRIETWRRGIAEHEASSMGTTVDGEFITPGASRHLIAEGVLDADDLKSRASRRSKAPKSVRSSRTSKTTKTKTHRSKSESRERKKSKKPPSGLRMLLTAHRE